MSEREILVESIITGVRRRTDLGDIEALAKSIADIGLLHPITIMPNAELVLGLRRLAAVKLLGWPTVPVEVIETLEEAFERTAIDSQDDIECRVMTPGDKVWLGMTLERVDEPAARKRRLENAQRNAKIRTGALSKPAVQSGNWSTNRAGPKIATALGWGVSTYNRAKHVVTTMESHPKPWLREEAERLFMRMEETGRVSVAYDNLRPLTRREDWQHTQGRPEPIVGANAQIRVINAALLTIGGATDGLARIIEIDDGVSPDQASRLAKDLADHRRKLETLINKLRRHATKGNAT